MTAPARHFPLASRLPENIALSQRVVMIGEWDWSPTKLRHL